MYEKRTHWWHQSGPKDRFIEFRVINATTWQIFFLCGLTGGIASKFFEFESFDRIRIRISVESAHKTHLGDLCTSVLVLPGVCSEAVFRTHDSCARKRLRLRSSANVSQYQRRGEVPLSPAGLMLHVLFLTSTFRSADSFILNIWTSTSLDPDRWIRFTLSSNSTKTKPEYPDDHLWLSQHCDPTVDTQY